MPEKSDEYQERLASLRDEIKKFDLDGYILPRTDEYQGEFLADYAERLAWLTGFTGSAGVAVILAEKAAVLSDGRYTIQLKNQVDSALYMTGDSTEISVGWWLSTNASAGAKIGYDPWLHTPKQIERMKEAVAEHGIDVVPVQQNLVDLIWEDQPSRPCAEVIIFPDEIAGRSSEEKRQKIASKIRKEECSACLITMSDSICWLLNVRGNDISFSPLVLSYALLHDDGSLDWFISRKKVSGRVLKSLGQDVRVHDFENFETIIKAIDGKVWLDRITAPIGFEAVMDAHGLDCLDKEDPCILPKSIKNESERTAIRHAHIQDGVAMVKFLKWVDDEVGKGGETELSVEAKLESFRQESKDYVGPSFPTIAGFGSNGAVVHYRSSDETNASIKEGGLLLVDSGGQYKWGTTDITRTIAIGKPTQEMKENYTRVLKGHIAVAKACFPKGTIGKEIDALARQSLQEAGLDYAHGTGHGVGCYLCVHEAAANMSLRGERAFRAGMLISNEPGYYKENEYGIRIENLVLVQDEDGEGMLGFETVSLAPFDNSLIDFSMLEPEEQKWLSNYNLYLDQALSSLLDQEHQDWLKGKIS